LRQAAKKMTRRQNMGGDAKSILTEMRLGLVAR